jgi:hypothetical protein
MYCSQPAGFLRKKHADCEKKFLAEKAQKEQQVLSAKNDILAVSNKAALGSVPIDDLKNKFASTSELIDKNELNRLMIKGWETAVDQVLSDNILTKDEESKLVSFLNTFSLTQKDVDQNGAYTRLAQSAILSELVEGKIPSRMTVQGNLPFNFKKDEQLIWLFKAVQYYEQKTSREFVGASHGVSIRIARGIYYRVGAFKGHPVETSGSVLSDTGQLCVTNQHIYFAGATKSFRIPYSKIVTITPYSDGVCIQRDAANAKPQSFVVNDGWFINNLIANLAKMQTTN